MRITLLFLLVGMLQVSASVYSQNTKLNVDLSNANFEEILDEIKKQSEYNFLYRSDIFEGSNEVDLRFEDVTLENILDNLLVPEGYTYVIQDNVVVIRKKGQENQLFNSQQQRVVKGQVTDTDGNLLPGVSVVALGTTTGTATAVDGSYSINVPAGVNQLVFSFIGLESQQVTIDNREVIDIVLKTDGELVAEVVVIGYGSVEKKDLTGSVATVKSEDLVQIKTQTIDQALVGQMTGVHVTASGGAPGSGAIVHIRGLSGIKGDNQPLYVVDGVPIVQNPNFGTLGLGTFGNRANPLLSINPNDIERVDVLKDASAAAIYGSRAANGVILVTTKRGTQNQAPSFNFSAKSTIQNPTNTYDYLSADEWIPLVKNAAQATLDQYPEMYWPYFPAEYAIVNDPNYFGDADTDWQKEITRNNALWNEYNFNVSGGSSNVNYYVSLTASDQESIFKGGQFDRYGFSSSLDAKITSKFKVGTSINYNYSVNKSSNLSNLQYGNFRPDLPVYDEDDNFTGTQVDYGYILNPLGDEARNKNKTVAKNMYGSVYGELELITGLKARSRVNLSLADSKAERFSPSFSKNAVMQAAYYSEEGARLANQVSTGYTFSFENTINYKKAFNDIHKFDALLGIAWDQSRLDLEAQTYLGFPDDEFLTNIQSSNDVIEWSSESLESGLNSYFGRFNYIYDERFLATFTARYDGSTKFGPDNKWGFFPSGALAWNMHNEAFLKDNALIDQLKLRASLGRTGQDNLPAFSYLAYYKSIDNGDSFYNGVNGIAVAGVPNTGIKWETTDQLDLGIEFGLFNYRLTGEIVYFEKNTSDIILLVPIAAETGSSAWQGNIADVSNKGWEIGIGGDIIRSGDLRWNSSFNISFVKNNVDDLKGGTTTSFGSTGIKEGYPIGVILGYDVVKIAQEQDEIDALNEQAGGRYQSTLLKPGDYIFRDVSGPDGKPDNKITTHDRIPLGDINPEFFGGWNNKISYKNLDFGFNWQFVQGAERNYDAISNLYSFQSTYNALDIVNETWREDFRDAPYARLSSGTHGYTPTSRSIVDASYIRLRSATIGYSLPQGWMKKISLSNVRLSLTGNNLITITDYPGLDPESVNTQRGGATIDMTNDGGYAYPNTRTFTVALNVTF
ncbi:TonB-dependent receptor [Sunxiuqinia indica]|uniref:TonB-dependent receptor n=1 Tax=Sunxiuqinia indica TaxID=2692584 RepID=UPI001359C721|nr:TonB-dependent receptor [Sunxiuqinia indica]